MSQYDSMWVQKRRRMVDDFVSGRTLVAALGTNPGLLRDLTLAMRDEIKDLRRKASLGKLPSRLVEDIVQGRTLVTSLEKDSTLTRDTALAMKEELAALREKVAPEQMEV
jgi:hypothetical protein